MVTDARSVRRRGRPSNRRSVLDAATRVALREGPGAVTIDAVVTEAGMSRGGVLYHFPSKDALLQALVDQDIDVVREMTGLQSGEAAARSREQRVRAYHDACTAWPPDQLPTELAPIPSAARCPSPVLKRVPRTFASSQPGPI